MSHLNAPHPRIQFTSEQLENVIENGSIKVKVYKKPTHTDQYLMFDSNHHIGQKLGIVSTLNHRIKTIVTTEEDQRKEVKEVKNALKECGYPEWALNRKEKDQTKRKDEECRGKVVLPYMKSLSENIAKVLRKYNVQTIHKPTRKLRSYVCNMKDKVHPMDKVGAIYEVQCTKHTADYTGETGRALKERGYEHKVVTHEEAEMCHSVRRKQKEKENVTEAVVATRRSSRNTTRLDYKALSTGENIIMNEGSTEVSKHMAQFDHVKGEVTIKALAYDTIRTGSPAEELGRQLR